MFKFIPKIKLPKINIKNFRFRLFHKILAIVIFISFCSTIGAVSSLLLSNKRLTSILDERLGSTFNEIFSNVTNIFSQLDDIAQENIYKASGLVALENVWKVFQDNQLDYVKASTTLVVGSSKDLSRGIKKLSEASTSGTSDVFDASFKALEDIEKEFSEKALSSQQLSELIQKKRDEIKSVYEKTDKNIAAAQSEASQKLDVLDNEVPVKLKTLQEQMDRKILAQVKDQMKEAIGKMGGADVVVSGSQDEALRQLEEIKRSSVSAMRKSIQEMYLKEVLILTLAMALLVGIFIAIAVMFTRSIVKPSTIMVDALQDMSKGDLTKEIKIDSTDEMGDLGKYFNLFAIQLREIIVKISSNSEKVLATSHQFSSTAEQTSASIINVSHTVQGISRGANSQLNQIKDMEDSCRKLTDNLKRVAESARQASEKSNESHEQAYQGKAASLNLQRKIDKIVETGNSSSSAIQELKESSREIGDIVVEITGFADQTNLLSLNAAIEAARAGEAGRGFAVVAEEVKKLAERSVNAANRISILISKIINEIDTAVSLTMKEKKEAADGLKIAGDTGSVQDIILLKANEVKELMFKISEAVNEQLLITENFMSVVGDIAGVAEQNASSAQELTATVEELTASTQEMSSGAGDLSRVSSELRDSIAQFKITKIIKPK